MNRLLPIIPTLLKAIFPSDRSILCYQPAKAEKKVLACKLDIYSNVRKLAVDKGWYFSGTRGSMKIERRIKRDWCTRIT